MTTEEHFRSRREALIKKITTLSNEKLDAIFQDRYADARRLHEDLQKQYIQPLTALDQEWWQYLENQKQACVDDEHYEEAHKFKHTQEWLKEQKLPTT